MVILKIHNWPYTARGPSLKTPGEQTLPFKRCGLGGKTIEYGRERAGISQPQIYRYSMRFTGNYDYSLHIKRLVFVMVKQKLHLCLFLYNI